MRNPIRRYGLTGSLLLCLLVQGSTRAQTGPPVHASSDLSGHWQARLDPTDEGLPAQWYARPLASSTLVHLPGSLAASGVGHAFDAQSGRYGAVMPPYLKWPSAGYTDQHRADDLGVLVSSRFYRGVCWYESEIDVPDWGGDPARLCLERVKWTSRCWVDGHEVAGEGNHSLYTPHRYDLGVLEPGVHRLTLRIDNRPLVNMGIAGHGYGIETEPLWNGVAGRMQLEALDPVRAESVRVQPAPDARSVTVLLQMARQTREAGPAEVVAQVVDIERGQVLGASRHQGSLAGEQVTLHIALDEPAQLWDEFQPRLYDLVVTCQNAAGPLHRQHCRFGFRTWRRDGHHLLLNGERVFLRGNVDCAIHPGSDTPPTDRDWWQRVLEIHKKAGFNHIRFHTWCPPEVAFDVADELGLYFQIETVYWVDNWIHATEPFPPRLGEDAAVDAWVREEAFRIIRAYERHPSFAMFCIGNEFGMDSHWDTIAQITADLNHATDQVLVSGTTARKTVPDDEYWVTHATGSGPARGIGPPHTNWDFGAAVQPVPLPVISHETGQRPSWPDYDALLPAFGNVMQPWNLKRLRERAEAAGVRDHARRAEATARFALAQYKAEHEGMRRTDELAGYQLLMLHDFTGQGEALVGLLDCFFREKPGITLEAIRSWNGPTVPLARFDKYTWRADETFAARLQVSHQGAASLARAVLQWKMFTRPSDVLAEGKLPATDIACHTLADMGEIRVPLSAVDRPAAVTLHVTVGGAVNSWNLWVYPPGQETDAPPPGVVVAQCLDAKAEQTLGEGGRVVLLTHGQRLPTARSVRWSSTYWTGAWGWGNGLGLLCEADHPALAGFPTELQSDWQWYELAEGGECLGVPQTAPNDGMIVQQISDFHTPAREACVYEARVGGGRLLVCTLDVASDLERRIAARALRASLFAYASSAEFQPRVELTLQTVRPWLRPSDHH